MAGTLRPSVVEGVVDLRFRCGPPEHILTEDLVTREYARFITPCNASTVERASLDRAELRVQISTDATGLTAETSQVTW